MYKIDRFLKFLSTKIKSIIPEQLSVIPFYFKTISKFFTIKSKHSKRFLISCIRPQTTTNEFK